MSGKFFGKDLDGLRESLDAARRAGLAIPRPGNCGGSQKPELPALPPIFEPGERPNALGGVQTSQFCMESFLIVVDGVDVTVSETNEEQRGYQLFLLTITDEESTPPSRFLRAGETPAESDVAVAFNRLHELLDDAIAAYQTQRAWSLVAKERVDAWQGGEPVDNDPVWLAILRARAELDVFRDAFAKIKKWKEH